MTLERPSAILRSVALLIALLAPPHSSMADDARCAEAWESVDMPRRPARQPQPAREPARWSESDRQRLEVARGFCEQPEYEAKTWKPAVPRIGCLPCTGVAPCAEDNDAKPVPVPPAQGPSPKLTPQSVAKLNLYVDEVVFGSFTQAGSDEAIAKLHSNTDSQQVSRLPDWERFYLMRKVAGRWSPVRYVESIGSFTFGYACKATRMASHRDLLVCMSGAMSGTSSSTNITVNDFARDPPVTTALATFGSTNQPTREVCMQQPGWSSFFLGSLGTFELVDVDHDGLLDVRAALAYAEVDDRVLTGFTQARDYSATCACAPVLEHDPYTRLKPGCRCPAFKFPALTQTSLIFLAQGERFVPTPTTVAVMKKAHAEPFEGVP
jgi:hypothetical protein